MSNSKLDAAIEQAQRGIRQQNFFRGILILLGLAFLIGLLSQFDIVQQRYYRLQTMVAPSSTPTLTHTLSFTHTSTSTFTPTTSLTPTLTSTPTRTPTVTSTPTPTPYPGVTTGNVRVRETPVENSKTFGFLYRNEPVLITGYVVIDSATWYRIMWANNKHGWVRAEYIGTNPPLPEAYLITYP